MADKVKYTDTTNNLGYVELKGKAESALTTTGAPFIWNSVVTVGTKTYASHIQEIVNAINTAYDAINVGCSTNYSTQHGSKYGYSNSNTSVCTSNLSSVNSSANPSNLSSNLTAKNSTNNSTVHSSKNSSVYSIYQ